VLKDRPAAEAGLEVNFNEFEEDFRFGALLRGSRGELSQQEAWRFH